MYRAHVFLSKGNSLGGLYGFLPNSSCGAHSSAWLHFRSKHIFAATPMEKVWLVYYSSMRFSHLSASSLSLDILPYHEAYKDCTTWSKALQVTFECEKLLKNIYEPTVEELLSGLKLMTTDNSLSIYYFGFLKGTLQRKRLDSHLVYAAVRLFRDYGNKNALRRILNEDVDISSKQGSRVSFQISAAIGMWENALKTFQENSWLSQNHSHLATMISSLGKSMKWEIALSIVNHTIRSQPYRQVPMSICRPLLICFERFKPDLTFRFLAKILANGHLFSLSLLTCIIRTLNSRGLWKMVLSTAQSFGAFSLDSSILSRRRSLITGLMDSLYHINPYSNLDGLLLRQYLHLNLNPMLSSTPVLLHTTAFSDDIKSYRLFTPCFVVSQVISYAKPLSLYMKGLWKVKAIEGRQIHQFVDDLSEDDYIIILDTNIIIQCVISNQSLDHYLPFIVQQQPHLKNKKIRHIIVPFTTLREVYRLVSLDSIEQASGLKKGILLKRIYFLLHHKHVRVMNFLTELSCCAFSIFYALYPNLVCHDQKDHVANPDLRILNVLLAFQHYIRLKSMSRKHTLDISPSEFMEYSLFYHTRRANGFLDGSPCDQLVLCTFDRRLSFMTDSIGVDTFPRFFGEYSRTRKEDYGSLVSLPQVFPLPPMLKETPQPDMMKDLPISSCENTSFLEKESDLDIEDDEYNEVEGSF